MPRKQTPPVPLGQKTCSDYMRARILARRKAADGFDTRIVCVTRGVWAVRWFTYKQEEHAKCLGSR